MKAESEVGLCKDPRLDRPDMARHEFSGNDPVVFREKK